MSSVLVDLLQALNAPQGRINHFNRYYRGDQQLSFTAPEVQKALSGRFPKVSVNYIRLAINSIAERLRVTGFDNPAAWPLWLSNNLDQRSALVHREALLTGAGYVSVWSNPDGSPRIAVESCREVITQVDPGSRETLAAAKRWIDTVKGETHAVLYLPDRIERYRASQAGAAPSALTLVETLDNPLGQVPVVAFRNSDLPLEDGVSEVADLTCLVDMLSKLTADLLVSSEYGARPRRFASGIELAERPQLDADGTPMLDDDGEPVIEAVNPFPESDRMMVSENDEAKFGQLPGASLDGYRNAVDVILSELSGISSLPPHYLGILHANPTSADSLRASEAGLTAKASAKQQVFGQAWEQVMQLAIAVQKRVDPSTVEVSVKWNDPATRSVAQESDAVLKLVQAGVLSKSGALRKLGYTQDEIAQELQYVEDDVTAGADPAVSAAHRRYAQLMIDRANKDSEGIS